MDKQLPTSSKVLLVVELARGHGRDFLHGISEYANKNGPWLFHLEEPILLSKKQQTKQLKSSLSWLPKWTPTGIITSVPELAKKFHSKGVPTILAFESYCDAGHGMPRIEFDHESIGVVAGKEFLNRGYSNFAYCGFDGFSWSQKRGDSFADLLAEKGFDVHLHYVSRLHGKKSLKKEHKALVDWLKQLPKPVGILACDDELGRDIIHLCRTENIKIPEEAAVLGVDDDYAMCNFCSPPLSSIKLDMKIAGYEVAELLDKMMAGKKSSEETILVRPLEVKTRQSTDIMAVREEDVNNAVSFIHKHGYEYIQVSDVVEAVAVSRRRLQEKFCSVLGRTINDEIKRVRAENISQMLLKTDMSVQQIALKFGYTGMNHIARFFKKQTGLTPTQFRKKYGRG